MNDGIKFMKENFVIFVEEISKWNGYKKYAENCKKLIPMFYQYGFDIYKQDNPNFAIKVLNHGDLYSNNMLVQSDKSGLCVSDVLFVSFRIL